MQDKSLTDELTGGNAAMVAALINDLMCDEPPVLVYSE